jgi:hypothetical protein
LLSTNHMRAFSVTRDAETGFNVTPIPQKALTLSRKVDECKPLVLGGAVFFKESIWERLPYVLVMLLGMTLILLSDSRLALSTAPQPV